MGQRNTARKYDSPAIRTFDPKPLDKPKSLRLMELVRAHAAAGQVDAALEAATSAVVLDCSNPEIRLEQAQAFYRVGAFYEALSWTESLVKDSRVYFLRGQIHSDLGQYGLAEESFSRVLELDPGFSRARMRRASVLLADGRMDQALQEIDTLLELEPNNFQARTMRAGVLLDKGHPRQALDDIDSIPEHRRTALHALLHVRCALSAGILHSEVDEIFESYLRLFPEHAQLRLAFAQHLSSKDTDPMASERAREELDRILRMSDLPGRIEAQACFLSAELQMDSEEDKAAALFQRGLYIEPDHPGGLAGMGKLFINRQRSDKAMPWLLRALMSEPDRQETIELVAVALASMVDLDAVGRWLALVFSGLPSDAPMVMARMIEYIQDKGRVDAYMDVRRLAHRMKNRVAVLAARVRTGLDAEKTGVELDELYEQWARFLDSMVYSNVSFRPLNVRDVVMKAVEQTGGDESLVLDLQPDLPLVRGDEQQLADALANIVSNALDASAGTTKVRIAARGSDSAKNVEISVVDYGQGLDSQALSRVFTPGYSTKPNGSGVGMFVARNVVQAHGGKLSVLSAPGGPTTVTIRLPSLAGWEAPSPGALDEILSSAFAGGRGD